MPHRRTRMATPLPILLVELSLASWETIARRSFMMATGACSASEYQRMASEKLDAAMLTGAAIARGAHTPQALLAPWHRRARANAKRLRKM